MAPRLELNLTPELLASLDGNRCINRVQLFGVVGSTPERRRVGSNLFATTFLLVTAEHWGRDGERKHHANVHLVEVLGKDSARAAAFGVGARVILDGYLRTESDRGSRVRTYAISGFKPEGELPQRERREERAPR